MSVFMLWGLWGVVFCLLLVLTWVGWRFFAITPDRALEPAHIGALVVAPKRSPSTGRSVDPRFSWRLGAQALAVFGTGCLVVGVVFLFSGQIAPDPLSVLAWHREDHIQAALNPERLVPPPPLPPSIFVGSERPALETADRDWNKLDPQFMQALLRMLSRLESRGYSFALLEGYRSPERQERLADLGSSVTNARAFQSKHQYGLAADIAPVRDGRLVISERDPWAMEAYTALGVEAERAGLTWGGLWSLKDYGHVEMAGARNSK
ncbi:M15 family metallopeptidase [Propionivibrio soli]|uniref:M15 family metallopeptidase n=1 Tax=Propionivibrio soli TaxID=2976531 RepID=UPI0021E98402|nr:M15 family metallopeptidase [Propionivibrio soli]